MVPAPSCTCVLDIPELPEGEEAAVELVAERLSGVHTGLLLENSQPQFLFTFQK